MATSDFFIKQEYYSNYKLAKGEIDLRSYLLDPDVEDKIASCGYPTPAVLSQLQRSKGQAPRDPAAKNVASFPPRRRKEEIFSADKFADNDAYVKSLLPKTQESERSFAARLFSRCRSNLDKARASFYFVCTADVDGMAESDDESSIHSAIRTMRRNTHTNSVCARLLCLADVPVVQINGTKKGVGYENGKSTEELGGSWLACYVEGEWRFIDAHWGSEAIQDFDTGNFAVVDKAGNVGSAVRCKGEMIFQVNEHFFLTDPDKLILTHYPEKTMSQWQLLVRPLNFIEFQKMLLYNNGCLHSFLVTPKSHPLNVIVAPPGTIEIFLTEMADGMCKYSYDAKISIHKKNINKKTRAAIKKQCNFRGYLSKMIRMDQNEVKFNFEPPCSGKFLLRINCTITDQDGTMEANTISYAIHSPQDIENVEELPTGSNHLSYYGADTTLIKAETHSKLPGEMKAPDGESLLTLIPVNSRSRMKLACLLMDSSKKILPENVLMWVTGCKISIIFLSPHSGWFALVVQDQNQGRDVCQFLIDSSSEFRDAHNFSIPDLKKLGGLGFLDEELNKLIQPDSHPDPYVKCDVESLELKFSLKVHMEIEAELLHIDSNGVVETSDGFAFVNGSGRGFCVDVRFFIAGHFVVRLKARRDQSDSLKHYGNYFVRSLGELDGHAEQFPDRLQGWNCGFRLIRPKNKHLLLNTWVDFIMQTGEEDVQSIYLFSESNSEQSQMQKCKNGFWQGRLKGDSAGVMVKVVSVSNEDEKSELLAYRFVSSENQNTRRNLLSKEANELNDRRRVKECIRQRTQENHERKKHRMELLPKDPIEEEQRLLRLKQEAEQHRREMEDRRKKEEIRLRQENEEMEKRMLERQRREEERRRKQEERQEKRERRRANSERPEHSAKIKKRKNKLSDKLALTLYRDPQCKSKALDATIKELEEEELESDDEALLLLSSRNTETAEFKRELESEISKAQKYNNPAQLKSLVNEINDKKFTFVVMSRLEPEFSDAKKLIEIQERQARSAKRQRQQKLELNQRNLADLCGRNALDKKLHITVQGTLLLLGHCELETDSWTRARVVLRRIGDRLNSQQADRVDPGIAARAQELLDEAGPDQLGIAASLHQWALKLASAVLEGHQGNCQPAVGRKQLKLLNVSSEQRDEWVSEGPS